MSAKVQLTGGQFQDSEGNVLALGYLTFELNQDGQVNTSQVCAGIKVIIQLDSLGAISSSPPQYVWGNDQLLPVNSYYKVTGYNAKGQMSWGPNNQQVIGSGGTFDVGTWIPNTVISWTPPPIFTPIEIQVNTIDADSQTILNLTDSATVTFSDNGGGSISATASVPAPTPQTGPRPNLGNWHGWSCAGGSTPLSSLQCYSDTAQETGVGDAVYTIVQATATEPPYYNIQTDTSPDAGTYGMYNGTSTSGFTVGILSCAMQRIQISTITDCRYWVGAFDSSVGAPIGANSLKTDVPAKSFIGFRYSTAAGDTNWMAVSNAAGIQTVADTGITPSSAVGHVFEMRKATGGVAFYIDSVLVATVVTNVPTEVLRVINSMENLSAAACSMSVAYMYWETSV